MFFVFGQSLFYKENQEMDEDSEKRAIEDLPVVSSVRFHAGDKTHKSGVYANLRCGCGAKQVSGGAHPQVERTSHEC